MQSPLDVVEAQTVTSGQLAAIRDKIVFDKLVLRKAVLSLFPNFNVNDLANMQSLEQDLISQYPEVAPALRSVRVNSQIKAREQEMKRLTRRRDPNQVLNLNVDSTNIPTEGVAFEDLRRKMVSLLNYELETARLKKVKSNSEKRLNGLV